jgi:hypothetical protein
MPTNQEGFMQFVNMVKSGNPKQNMLNILRERAQGNPMFANMLSLAQSGNTQEIEKIARNVAQEKGLDFDTEFNSFKQKFGL